MLSWEYPPRIIGGVSRHAYEIADALCRKGVKVDTVLRKGVVHEEVAHEVEEYGCDLLVQGELGEVLSLRDSFYEEGERILRKVKCPVMVVRGRDRIEKLFDGV